MSSSHLGENQRFDSARGGSQELPRHHPGGRGGQRGYWVAEGPTRILLVSSPAHDTEAKDTFSFFLLYTTDARQFPTCQLGARQGPGLGMRGSAGQKQKTSQCYII